MADKPTTPSALSESKGLRCGVGQGSVLSAFLPTPWEFKTPARRSPWDEGGSDWGALLPSKLLDTEWPRCYASHRRTGGASWSAGRVEPTFERR